MLAQPAVVNDPPLACTPNRYAERMSQIAVRLTDAELELLDSAVSEGGFPTRAEAVRAGIRMLSDLARERRIKASYERAYRDAPPTGEEAELLDAAAALAAELPV